jgi:fumarate reductase subunit C
VRCIDCDFDLVRTTDGRCPECGRAFDAADVGTYIGEGHARIARRSAAAPGWPMWAMSALLGLLILRTDFSPGRSFGDGVVALLAGLVFVALYIIRLIVALAARSTLPKRRPRVVPIALWRWLLPIGIVLAAQNIAALRVPRMVAFWFDRSALEAVAQGPAIEPSAWVSIPAWSGRVDRGAVWTDIEVVAFDPTTELGRAENPFDLGYAWELAGNEIEFVRKSRGSPTAQGAPSLERILRLRLARLAVFPIAGKGYGGFSEPAWAYAQGAPDIFILPPHDEEEEIPYPLASFRRFSGDWFVSLSWIQKLEDRPKL